MFFYLTSNRLLGKSRTWPVSVEMTFPASLKVVRFRNVSISSIGMNMLLVDRSATGSSCWLAASIAWPFPRTPQVCIGALRTMVGTLPESLAVTSMILAGLLFCSMVWPNKWMVSFSMPSSTSLQTGQASGRVDTLTRPARSASRLRKTGWEHSGQANSRAHIFPAAVRRCRVPDSQDSRYNIANALATRLVCPARDSEPTLLRSVPSGGGVNAFYH